MKKGYFYLIALLLGVILLCGCSGNIDTDTASNTGTEPDTETESATDSDSDLVDKTETSTENESSSTETNGENDSNDKKTDTNDDSATDTSKDTEKPEVPSKNTQTVTWQFNYDYGFHHESTATLLVDYSKLVYGFENVTIPDDIVAGDTITIEYTGDMYILESYPGRTELYGEVVSYSFKYASVTKEVLTASTIDRIRAEYDIKDEYVIINRGGEYKTLEECTGRYIYLVTDQKRVKEQKR